MRRRWGRVGALLAAAALSIAAAGTAWAAEAGPGAGMEPVGGGTIDHRASAAGSGEKELLAGGQEAESGTVAVELAAPVAEITGQNGVSLSAAPGSGENYGYAHPGMAYRVTGGADNGWIEIAYDGHTAYLDGNSGEITVRDTWEIPAADGDRSGLVRFAMQYLGSAYKSGGTDPADGVDCSGFVRYVMGNQAGIEMPRSSREQALVGEERTAETMQAGDLISYGPSLDAVSHVGIYIGNGRIIHGDGAGRGVTVTAWDDRTDIPRIASVL